MKYSGIGTTHTKCPFFVRESELQITCEGVIENADTASKFATEKEKIRYQVKQCFRYPNECPVAKMNERKYEE